MLRTVVLKGTDQPLPMGPIKDRQGWQVCTNACKAKYKDKPPEIARCVDECTKHFFNN